MKESIKVSISTVSFNIDDEAYAILDNYLNSLKQHFAHTPDCIEIISDIEMRIAELLQMRLNTPQGVVSYQDVTTIINIMGNPKDFVEVEENESDENSTPTAKETTSPTFKKRLYRDMDQRTIGGVCGGLSHYFKVDAVIFRILLILLFFGSGTIFEPQCCLIVVAIYLILWLAMPKAITFEQKVRMTGTATSIADISNRSTNHNKDYRGSTIREFLKLGFRIILVGIGIFCTLFITCLFIFLIWASFDTSFLNVQNYFDFVNINSFSFKLALALFIALPVLGLINLIVKLYRFSPFKAQNFILLLIGFGIWIGAGTYLTSKIAPWIYKFQYGGKAVEVVDVQTSSEVLYIQLDTLHAQATLLPSNPHMLYRDNGDIRDFSLLPYRIQFTKLDSAAHDQSFKVELRTSVRAENWNNVRNEVALTKSEYSVTDSLVTIAPQWYNKNQPWDMKESYIYITVPHGKRVELLGYLNGVDSYWHHPQENIIPEAEEEVEIEEVEVVSEDAETQEDANH